MKRLLWAVLCFLCLRSFGQIDHSVDIATGTVNVNYPLFTISSGDISVNSTLSYVANGIKVNEDDGWIAQNWSLSGGSYGVFREMRNLPDDYSATSPDLRKGWITGGSTIRTNIKNFTPTTDGSSTTCSDEPGTYTFLNSLTYNQDTEPDVFHVSAPGLSLSFYFDENNVPQVVPYQDVTIVASTASGAVTSSTTTGPITSILITDSNGVKYLFSDTESVTESVAMANAYFLVRRTNMHLRPFTYFTSWKLTSITSPIYGVVNFTYKAISLTTLNPYHPASYRYRRTKYQYPITVLNCGGSPVIEYSRQSTIKQITKISSTTHEAVFNTIARFPGTVLERLTSIDLFEKREGTTVKFKTFTLGILSLPSTEDYRAILRNVTEQNGQLNQSVWFSYNGDANVGGFTNYSSSKKDEWDFYSDPTSKPYDETVALFSLSQIYYPSRGYVAFIYEPHEYIESSIQKQGAGMRVKRIISHDGIAPSNDKIVDYEYKKEDGSSSGKLQYRQLSDIAVVKPNNLYTPCVGKFDKPMSYGDAYQGSAVAYTRVKVKYRDNGSTVFEYDLPASFGDLSANSNEWTASLVDIARPATGTSTCYAATNIPLGANNYPYPPNPNYDFARGLLTKSTDYALDGRKVGEALYEYQRVYGGSAIKKIYGLSLEEIS